MPNRRQLVLAAIVFAGVAGPAAASAAGEAYAVEIWSDATFGPDGKLQQLDVADTEKLPPVFVERVRRQLANARIPPVKDSAGEPATFRTGVRLAYEVTPGEQGGTVRTKGMQIAPRPTRQYAASQPEGLPADTPLSVRVRCEVGVDGRCGAVKVVESTGTSEVLRRWAVASMRGWTFEPQRINGQPMPGEAEAVLVLTLEDLRPADFRNPLKL